MPSVGSNYAKFINFVMLKTCFCLLWVSWCLRKGQKEVHPGLSVWHLWDRSAHSHPQESKNPGHHISFLPTCSYYPTWTFEKLNLSFLRCAVYSSSLHYKLVSKLEELSARTLSEGERSGFCPTCGTSPRPPHETEWGTTGWWSSPLCLGRSRSRSSWLPCYGMCVRKRWSKIASMASPRAYLA